MNFEVIIGIEIHCELKTKTKMFSSAPVDATSSPNTNVNEIDLAHPGTLPSVNKEAVKLALKACHALNCEIDPLIKFDRKNYFYSDLPKGYQITQQFHPIGKNGSVNIDVNGESKKVRINRIHMEEDTAKQYHLESTCIDYNRAGTPLIEIVSEADIRSGEEACRYIEAIRAILLYLNVSDVKMEEGSLRCDVNISLRPYGYAGFGIKTEIKNLNSISNVQKAIDYEIVRQSKLLLRNEVIEQETRRYDEATKTTVTMRKKEGAIDYRYFPEPNIVPILLSESFIQDVYANMEELPDVKKARWINQCGLSDYDAAILIANKSLGDLFDEVTKYSNAYKLCANWLIGEYTSYVNKNGASQLIPTELAKLVNLVEKNELSSKQAKQVFEQLMEGKFTDEVIKSLGIKQISDENAILSMIEAILLENAQSVEDYLNGKDRAIKHLIGQIMKQSKGQVNPQLANTLLVRCLEKRR